ncbi:Short transient receptor potential channel 5 [Holothuria leucospilota]|uniref:Short transient receptor potential channel 5 n=1 Tax=Holothuria leucospilota TaxID=206669 RepID=A0A9Q1BYJ8_HOLLE|nr:Short transient receptor potential channel 5 [Holothuria leucospilota]
MGSDDQNDYSLDEDGFKSYKMSFPTPELLFLTAVRDGDIGYVEQALEDPDHTLDVNITTPEGLTPLSIAVKNGHKLIVQQLLKHSCAFGDSLLRAVDSEFFDAVFLICKYAEAQGSYTLREVLNCRCEGDEFHPEITPIMLACHSANYNIIKLLLGYGARVPDPSSAELQRTEQHTLQHSVGILNLYRAHSCGLYIAMTSPDPIATAFSLGEQLQKLSISEYEFRQEYKALLDDVEQFAADMLGQARNSKELEIVMRHYVTDKDTEGGEDATPERLGQAINLEQKKFVAHPHCQQLLMNKFYGSFNRKNSYRYWVILFLITVGYPVLALAFIVFPSKSLAAFMRTPKVKFQMDVGSRLTFLIFLIIISSNSFEHPGDDFFNMSNIPFALTLLLTVWVAGRTLSEVYALYREGFGRLLSFTTIFDIVILLLYWTCLILTFWAMVNYDHGKMKRPKRAIESYESVREHLMPQLNKSIQNAVRNSKMEIQDILATRMSKIDDYLLTVKPNTTNPPKPDENSPETWAMAMFALATTASFIRLLVLTLSSQFIGPLQISLGGMFYDILKFVVVFVVVWAAFGIGLNTIFYIYETAEQEMCQQSNAVDCRDGPFSSVWTSMQILFWSLFGLVDLNMLSLIPDDHWVTKQLARLMFGVYMMVAVVVMLNALIAMMSNTYTRVEENSDTEWKFARAKMWISFLQPHGVVPPPFNLIPGVEDFKKVRKFITKKCSRNGRDDNNDRNRQKAERFEKQFNEVVRQFVERYIVEQTSVGSETAAEVTRKDIMAIRTDVAIFKYEAFKSLKVTNNIFQALSEHLDTTKGKLTPVDLANKTAILISDKIRESKEDTRLKCEKVVEYLKEYSDQVRTKLGLPEEGNDTVSLKSKDEDDEGDDDALTEDRDGPGDRGTGEKDADPKKQSEEAVTFKQGDSKPSDEGDTSAPKKV